MEVDPAASFRIWGVDLDLGGRAFTIPPLPAADWLPMLMVGRTLDVLDLVDDPNAVDDLITTGEVSPNEIREAARSVIEQVAGRDPDAATVIAQTASRAWPVVGGELVRQGIRMDEIPLGAALDALHLIIVRNLKPEPLARFQTALGGQIGKPAHPDRRAAEAHMEAEIGPKPAPAPVPAPASGGPSANARPKTRQRPRQRPRADQ